MSLTIKSHRRNIITYRAPRLLLVLSACLIAVSTPLTLLVQHTFAAPANYAQSGWVNPHIQLGGANGISLDQAGNRYVADIDNYKVRKYSPSGQPLMSFGASDWQSTTDGFGTITDVAVDSRGIIYVADGDNYRVQVYDQNGNFLRTIGGVSGTGDGELNYAYQMVVDSHDNLYVIDDKRVQEFDKDGNFLQVIATPDMIHTYSGGYTSSTIQSIAVDRNDAIYVTEASYLTLSQVQKFSSNGTLLASFGTYNASRSNPTPGAMQQPGAIAVDSLGNVFVDDFDYINVFNSAGVAQSKTFIGDVGTEQIAAVGDMVFDSSDNLQIANIRPNRILTLNHSLQFVSVFGQSDTQNGHFYGMLGVYRDEVAGKMYVSDALNGRIQVLDLNGNYLSQFGSYGNNPGQLDRPGHIVKNPITGNLYINDHNGLEIFTPSGSYVTRLLGFGSAGIAFDASGKMYTATDQYSVPSGGAIRDNAGNILSTFGATGTPATGKLLYPTKVALDASGNIYVADGTSNYIQIYAPDGTFLRQLGDGTLGTGNGQFSDVNDIQVASDGTVYAADTGNGRFQVFDNNGTYLSQFGTQGFGPGKFKYPQAFSIASDGTMYIADDVNDFLAVYRPSGNTAPSAPTNFAVSGDSSATWSAPASNGGSAVVSYTLRHKSTSATNWAEVTLPAGTTSYSFGSQPADTYQYELTASNSAGESGAAAPGSAATTATAPQTLNLTTSTANTLSATWQAPASDGGSSITGYLFEYKPAASSSWTQLTLPASPTSHTLSNVPAGNYDVRVSAINSAGTSVPGAVMTIAIADAPAPSHDPTPSPAPTTPYVAPPAGHAKVSDATTESSSLITPDSTESPTTTLKVATSPGTPGAVTVVWQAPTGQPPTGYVIEYRDASVPASDTTTPWHYAAAAGANKDTAVITLPAGEYNVRVAALFPGEQPRIILGVAHISVAAYNAAMGTANHSTTPAATTKAKSVPLWIVACVCGLMTAFLFIIFVAWKRRRKKQQKLSTNTYRQRL